MIRRARLDRLEASLTPTAAVSLWLEEAHAFDSLPAYTAWSMGQPRAAGPVVRIRDQVRTEVERRLRGHPRASVEQAADTAVREACFRIALVLELNNWTATDLQIARLEQSLLLHIAYIVDIEGDVDTHTRSRMPPLDPEKLQRARIDLRVPVASHVIGLYAAVEVRRDLERRYLGGHAALFPDLIADQEQLIGEAAQLSAYAHEVTTGWSLSHHGGGDDEVVPDLGLSALRAAARARAPGAAATHVAQARLMMHDLLGEHRQARILAGRLLRQSLYAPPIAAPPKEDAEPTQEGGCS